MPYRLKPSRSIESEIKRIADKQLTLAIAELRAPGEHDSDEAIHLARRHVKKVRALIRLVQPALGEVYDDTNKRMRAASRMLAPIADGAAVVETVATLRRTFGSKLARRTLASIRAVLIERSVRIDRKAELDRVRPTVAAILNAERKHVAAWTLNTRGYPAIAPGLDKSLRHGRRAALKATTRPTADRYHIWRRRIKDLWFQVRLIDGRCGDGLSAERRRLEALDGCLGEYHNVILLERILATEALVSRQQTAHAMRLLRRYQSRLRRRARTLADRIFSEKPRHLLRRVKRLWRSSRTGSRRSRRIPWPRAA